MSTLRYLTSCLLLISISSFVTSQAQSQDQDSLTALSCKNPISTVNYKSSAVKLKSLISFQNAQISGITIVKLKHDSVFGAFVNEFGVVGFEFVVCDGKCKLTKLIKNLDKWYIRRTLSEDLAFIFSVSERESQQDSVHTFILSRNKQYRYILEKNGNIKKSEYIRKGNVLKDMVVNNHVISMTNNKRKLNYIFTPIEEIK